MPLLAAALLGGLIGGGATIAYQASQDARPASADPRLAQFTQQIAAAAPRDAVTALERRLAAIEAQGTAFDERLRSLQTQAERNATQAQQALNRPIPTPPPPPNPAESAAFSSLAARVGSLESTLQTGRQEASQADAALERRIADQDGRLAALAQRMSEQGSDAMQASLRAVLADRVLDSVRAGAPFADALTTLSRLNAEPAPVAALQPFAASGAPNAEALASEWKAEAERIAAQAQAAEAAQPPQSASDTFWNLAGRVIQISPANGSSTRTGELAAVTTALEAGRLDAAAAAWDTLPEPTRQASQAFGQRLKQRVAAGAAAQTLSADAVKRLEAAVR